MVSAKLEMELCLKRNGELLMLESFLEFETLLKSVYVLLIFGSLLKTVYVLSSFETLLKTVYVVLLKCFIV